MPADRRARGCGGARARGGARRRGRAVRGHGTMTRLGLLVAAFAAFAVVAGCGGGSGGRAEVRIPLGAGGVGFLPLYMMREHGLIEKHARAAGLDELAVRWIDLG